MTGRQRLTAIMNREPVDRLPWTILVDGHTLSGLPDSLNDGSGMAFARHLSADILQLEGWGTPHGFASPAVEWGRGVVESHRVEQGESVRELRGPAGRLTSASRHGHPVKHLVETLDDVRAYTSIWEGARYAPHDDSPAFSAVDSLVGDDGLVMRFWGPSTIPRLLELDMGTAPFYYLMQDHPVEMERLIAVMHERELEAFRLLATGPCDVLALVENTSTAYISPDVYRRHNGPHVRDFVDAVHARGKTALIHMCGHVRGLLDQIKETGLDGVHALTPPPTGDTPWEMALDAWGDDAIIVGVLDPTIFVTGPIEEIPRALDRLYTPRVRETPCVLCLFADGIPVPRERFETVAEWMTAQPA